MSVKISPTNELIEYPLLGKLQTVLCWIKTILLLLSISLSKKTTKKWRYNWNRKWTQALKVQWQINLLILLLFSKTKLKIIFVKLEKKLLCGQNMYWKKTQKLLWLTCWFVISNSVRLFIFVWGIFIYKFTQKFLIKFAITFAFKNYN